MTELPEAVRVLGIGLPTEPLGSEVEYLDFVTRGLPVKALDHIADAVAPGDTGFRYRIVPKASLVRLRARRRLGSRQSVIVTRLASVWAQALRVWKSAEGARGFLGRPHSLLGGRRPIDLVLENEIGADLVRGVLGGLEHGSAV